MTWNNRIFRHKTEVNPGEWQEFYRIHEVYYDDDGRVENWTEEAILPYGDTPDELITHLEQMLGDARKSKDDVLEYEEEKELAEFSRQAALQTLQ